MEDKKIFLPSTSSKEDQKFFYWKMDGFFLCKNKISVSEGKGSSMENQKSSMEHQHAFYGRSSGHIRKTLNFEGV